VLGWVSLWYCPAEVVELMVSLRAHELSPIIKFSAALPLTYHYIAGMKYLIGAKTGRGVGLVSMYRAAVLVMAASLGSAVALACISI